MTKRKKYSHSKFIIGPKENLLLDIKMGNYVIKLLSVNSVRILYEVTSRCTQSLNAKR